MKALVNFLTLISSFVFTSITIAQPYWKAVNWPQQAGPVLSLAINNTNGNILAGTNHWIYRSTDSGESWTQVNFGIASASVFPLVVTSQGFIFAGARIGQFCRGVYRSLDNGLSWEGSRIIGIGDYCITALVVNSNNSSGEIFAGTVDGRVYRTWEGTFWYNFDTGLTRDLGVWNTVYSLSGNQEGHLFAGTQDGIFRILNNTATWVRVRPGSSVHGLAISSRGHIFARVYGNGIYRSTDNGNTWTPVLLLRLASSLAVGSDEVIFAGTEGEGVYQSTDNGDNWKRINEGLTNLSVTSFVVDSSGLVFVGTQGGVFEFVGSTTSITSSSKNMSTKFELAQNYPNPFNPATALRFQIPRADHVVLKIFNIFGQEICTLVDAPFVAGRHSLHWDGKDRNGSPVVNGVYLYMLQVGAISQTKKMSLLR